MTIFTKKSLTPPKRICLRLREARECAKIPLETVAKKTRTSSRYLLALEECRFHDLPFSHAYQKHLIKAYMRAIGIHPEPYLLQFEHEELWRKKKEVAKPRRPKPFTRFMSLPLFLRAASALGIALLCMGYLGLQVKRIIEPPRLLVYAPQQGDILSSGILTVLGKTEPEVQVTINGTPVTQNKGGEFTTTLELPSGVNTLTIAAKKKHGKTTTLVRNVIVREERQFSFTGKKAREL